MKLIIISVLLGILYISCVRESVNIKPKYIHQKSIDTVMHALLLKKLNLSKIDSDGTGFEIRLWGTFIKDGFMPATMSRFIVKENHIDFYKYVIDYKIMDTSNIFNKLYIGIENFAMGSISKNKMDSLIRDSNIDSMQTPDYLAVEKANSYMLYIGNDSFPHRNTLPYRWLEKREKDSYISVYVASSRIRSSDTDSNLAILENFVQDIGDSYNKVGNQDSLIALQQKISKKVIEIVERNAEYQYKF